MFITEILFEISGIISYNINIKNPTQYNTIFLTMVLCFLCSKLQ